MSDMEMYRHWRTRGIIERRRINVLDGCGCGFRLHGASCAAVGGFLVHREIDAVNRKVSAADQISYSFMYPGKMQKIKSAYKSLYPTGNVESWRVRLQIAMFAFLALAAICLGFFK